MWLKLLREIDPIVDLIVWFLYNLRATVPCIVGVLLVKYGKGKWLWQICYAIGMIYRAYLFLGLLSFVIFEFSFHWFYYLIGETLLFVPFLMFYEREIRNALKKRELEKENV